MVYFFLDSKSTRFHAEMLEIKNITEQIHIFTLITMAEIIAC